MPAFSTPVSSVRLKPSGARPSCQALYIAEHVHLTVQRTDPFTREASLPTTSFSRKSGESWHVRKGRERRRADRVHDHGKPGVVPVDADHVDHALFPKFADRFGVGGIADALIAM